MKLPLPQIKLPSLGQLTTAIGKPATNLLTKGKQLTNTALTRSGQFAHTATTAAQNLANKTRQITGNVAKRTTTAAQQLGNKSLEQAYFMAGKKPGEPVGLTDLLTFAFSPNYPGLDRGLGISKNVFKPVVNRPYDRTRQLTAHALRNINRVNFAASLPAMGYNLLYEYPRNLPVNLAQNPTDDYKKQLQQNTGLAAVPHILRLVAAASGLSQHPYDQYIGQQVRQNILPELQNSLRHLQTEQPIASRVLDVTRSTSPGGLLTTLLKQKLTEEAPYNVTPPTGDEFLNLLGSSPEDAVVGPVLEKFTPLRPLQPLHDVIQHDNSVTIRHGLSHNRIPAEVQNKIIDERNNIHNRLLPQLNTSRTLKQRLKDTLLNRLGRQSAVNTDDAIWHSLILAGNTGKQLTNTQARLQELTPLLSRLLPRQQQQQLVATQAPVYWDRLAPLAR